jgi:hypothetical protein
MTTPINLKRLHKRIEEHIGPIEYLAWDKEPDHYQVYGDNGTICETHNEELAALIADLLRANAALIDTAEAAVELSGHLVMIGGGRKTESAYYRLRETLNRYTNQP